jgi:hypothetical protein
LHGFDPSLGCFRTEVQFNMILPNGENKRAASSRNAGHRR